MRRVSPTRATSEQHVAVENDDGNEIGGGARLDVFERYRSLRGHEPPDEVDDRGRVAFAFDHRAGRGFERTRQHEGRASVLGREIRVAARQRETVGLAHDRAAHDLDRQVEILDESPDDRELLCVLAPEERRARPDDREQLGDDGRDTVEVGGPRGPAQIVGEAGDVNRRERPPARIHLGDRRREHRVDALGDALREVAGEVAGVAVEIFAGAELQRVDEDGDHDEIARLAHAARISERWPSCR